MYIKAIVLFGTRPKSHAKDGRDIIATEIIELLSYPHVNYRRESNKETEVATFLHTELKEKLYFRIREKLSS